MKGRGYKFVAITAATVGTRLKGALYRFGETGRGEVDWSGTGGKANTHDAGTPITDRTYWEGRYALCVLTLENSKGERLTIDNAIVSVSQQKQIVTTQVVGRRGTVKEYISDGDYAVNISVGIQPIEDGTIKDEYPIDGVRELRKFLTESESLRVQSTFLDLWEITRIVVKSFNATQATASNYQQVQITADSDEEYNVYSTEY